MQLKIGTFNILNEKNVYGNLKCDVSKYNKDDNMLRTDIIMEILYHSNFDLLFLQEVGVLFRTNEKYLTKLSEKYYIMKSTSNQNWLCILISKSKFKNPKLIDAEKFKDRFASGTILNAVLFVEAQTTNNQNISFIDMHLMTDVYNKKDTLTMVENYVNQSNMTNIIIAGDMNDENNLFNTITKLQKVPIDQVTSYSLGSCVNNKLIVKTMTPIYRKLDQVYLSRSMTVNRVSFFDDFNPITFQLLSTNTFNSYGPPFCFKITTEQKIEDCEVKDYKYALENLPTKWPSDHVLVQVDLTIGDLPKTTSLKPTSAPFVPGQMARPTKNQPTTNQPTKNQPMTNQPINRRNNRLKYLKYKIKYINLKKKIDFGN